MAMADAEGPVQVVLYYKYVRLDEGLKQVLAEQQALCEQLKLRGRVRIALEGINGTLAGPPTAVEQYIRTMSASPYFDDIDWKTSSAKAQPFADLQVRQVQEIVTLEVPEKQCDLAKRGEHLTPEQFHAEQLNGRPEDIALIDVRNAYEYHIGHFEGALNPKTRRFGQFPQWVQQELPQLQQKDKILMYCTGGIRCEKASAYLRHLGLENVYQLEGGIHRYLERFPDGGLFRGKNFVFDQRASMASLDPTIMGHCERCSVPFDRVTGETRCEYCRTHVIVCEACVPLIEHIMCAEHAPLVQGSKEELEDRLSALKQQMKGESGRSRKGRRRSLRKQMDTVTQRIRELGISP